MKYLACLLLLTGVISCNQHGNVYEQFLNERLALMNDPTLDSFDTIVIIPRSGCNSCIDRADRFFQENIDKDMTFIFTGVDSRKQLELTLGKRMLERHNVVIDVENRMYSSSFEDSGYPLMLIRKNDKEFSYNVLSSFF